MNSTVNRRTARWLAVVAAASVALASTLVASPAADAQSGSHPRVQLDDLDRGLVAAATPNGVFLSWRLLGEEVTGSSAQGIRGPAFHVYRGRKLIATVTDSTNYLDRAGTGGDHYRVVSVVRGRELDRSRRSRPGLRTTSTSRCRNRPTG